jgi:hypothetical protein
MYKALIWSLIPLNAENNVSDSQEAFVEDWLEAFDNMDCIESTHLYLHSSQRGWIVQKVLAVLEFLDVPERLKERYDCLQR